MIAFVDVLVPILLRTTISLTLAALVVRGLLWITRPHSPAIHRLAWGCVLLQTVILSPVSLEIPWFESIPRQAIRSTEELPDFLLAMGRAEPRPSPAPLAESPDDREAAVLPVAVPPASSKWSISTWFVVVWASGIVIVSIAAAASYGLLLRSLRRAWNPGEELQEEWRRIMSQQGLTRPIPLRVHKTLGPMLCRLPLGYCVVVPEELWNRLSTSQRISVLRHELAHYQRHDIWQSLGARLLALPHWFNPLAWWTIRKFDEVSEWACDQRMADAQPRFVPDFARALLEMVECRTTPTGTTSVRGGSLSERFRRLLALRKTEDSRMKRYSIIVILLGLATAGLFRVQLVAKEQPETESATTDTVFDDWVSGFARRIVDDGESDSLDRLKEALATPAGIIVMQDRAAHAEEMIREEARADAFPRFIDSYFVRDGDNLRLRENQEEFRDRLLSVCHQFNQDVEQMKPAVQEIAASVSTDTNLGRLVVRFLNHDAAPTMIYVEELRARLRPDEYLVRERLSDLFVETNEGDFLIRPTRRDEATSYLRRAREILKHVKYLREELLAWTEEFAESDELHQRVRHTLADPLFAMMVASQILHDEDTPINERIDGFFEDLEHTTEDTGDGLTIVHEQRGEVEKHLAQFIRLRSITEKLSGPLQSFTERIRPGDELSDGWRELLKTELALLYLAEDLEIGASDPAEAIRAFLGEVLEKDEDGTYHVGNENPEEVSEYIQHMFYMYRAVRRKGRVVDELAAQVSDTALRDAMTSMGGKFAIAKAVEKSTDYSELDGLKAWIDQFFETTDEGLLPKEWAHDEIEDIVEQVRELTQELEKDDF